MLACLPIASLIRCWRTWCYLPCFRTMEHLGMKNGASKSLGLLHVLFSLMSSWFWPFGGWYVDVQRNSFLSWRIWELQLQAAERELPHLSQKVLLGEIKSNSVMMSERKSTLSHQWAVKTRQKGALQDAFQSLPCPCESDHGLNVASAGVLHSDTVIFHGSHLMQCPSALGWG